MKRIRNEGERGGGGAEATISAINAVCHFVVYKCCVCVYALLNSLR